MNQKKNILEIQDLHVTVDGKEILKGVDLKLESGKSHALMGPNGSGKSTLAYTLMGHPKYVITKGKIIFEGKDVTALTVTERSKLGIFLSFQYPSEIPGVTISNMLRTAINNRRAGEGKENIAISDFRKLIKDKMNLLQMDEKFMTRYLNDGFSGGEKKRAEILQLLMLDPKLAILDETDSGLDVDALRIVSSGVNAFMNTSLNNEEPDRHNKTAIVITHYKRILEYIHPDKVFVLMDGRIVLEGDGTIVDQLESKGYAWVKDQLVKL